LVTGDFISCFESRSLEDIRAMGGNTLDEERSFAAVARLSEAINGLYRTTAQPLVRSLATEKSAEFMRRMHPLRLSYELISDSNPALQPLASAAQKVQENRQPVAADNPFLQWEKTFSDWMTQSLNAYRDWRDMMSEQMFFGIYEQPWVQAMLGLRASDDPPRRHPGDDPDHTVFVKHQVEELQTRLDKGGPREAAIRAMIYVCMPGKAVDERSFEVLRRIRNEHGAKKTLAEFKQDLREQYLLVKLDENRAISLIPELLKGHENEGPKLLEYVRQVATAGGPLGEESQKRMAQLERLFISPLAVKQPGNKPAASTRKKA